MKKLIFKTMVLAIILIFQNNLFAQELTALEIVSKADQKTRGETSQGTMTMKIVRPSWERTVEMKSWSKSDDFFLIYITAPAKEKGQVFLKRYKEMWNWIPSINRMVKIPPSMMMQSWMGSDFTNDDLVKQSSIVMDYEHKLLGEETIRGQVCYKIELIPKPDAPVVWGKIISWITKDGFNVWKNEYYDEDIELINVENAYDLKDFGDRTIPSRMEIEPVDEPGNKTILTFEDMKFNEPISDDFFSQQNMKQVR
ncbi:MAG TPA: outer membrane lipoprotein-sorting protein [Bacteroidales bacterium]|nr:outer membrane lipoprotein-sorting protein [Bacteroidales bacterium]HRX97658.1 outer membrane lipoprotein-sorting protein [Bacteroidales bacterium]